MKVFSKEEFKKHAPKNIQRILSKHLDSLDGVEAIPIINDNYLWIPSYYFENEERELYPVDEMWCIDTRVIGKGRH